MVGIIFIIVGIVLLLLQNKTKPSKNEPERIPGVGVIRRRIQDGSYTTLYVEFRDQMGNVHLGKSVTYKSTKGKYQVGETAYIRYFFAPNGGRPFVVIDDPELVPCGGDGKAASSSMLVIAIVLLALGALLLVM